MLRAARAEDWARVAALEVQRRQQAEALFADPLPEAAVEVVRRCIQDLLEIDPELQRLVVAARDDAGEAVRQNQTGQAAVSAYRRYSR